MTYESSGVMYSILIFVIYHELFFLSIFSVIYVHIYKCSVWCMHISYELLEFDNIGPNKSV